MSQIQAIGNDPKAFKKTRYRLSSNALEIVDDWLGWVFYGTLDADGDLFAFREVMMSS
ncbi:MAG: hypothetical protein HY910_12075 [Desulfarculus sp.]|nr:hypothetical protein [Desulfarculus sp.]